MNQVTAGCAKCEYNYNGTCCYGGDCKGTLTYSLVVRLNVYEARALIERAIEENNMTYLEEALKCLGDALA